MELLELKANTRTETGKGPARVLRREGRIPAILYGPKTDPIQLSVKIYDMEQLLKKAKSRQQLVSLDLGDGGAARPAMIKELQAEPLSRNFRHVDFYEVDMDKKIKVNVPIVTVGKSKGVEDGGLLQIIRRELEVICLPNAIPEKIEIDIADLDVGDSVHVEEIALEGDIEIPAEVNFTVVTILSTKKQALEDEEGAEEEGAEAGDAGDAGGDAETEE